MECGPPEAERRFGLFGSKHPNRRQTTARDRFLVAPWRAHAAGRVALDSKDTRMVTVGMYYDVVPGKGPVFTAKFQEVIAALGAVPGHKATYLYQRVSDPDSYAILSEWEDQQSFLAFIRSDTFRQVTTWGKDEVLRNPPRHKIYPRVEDIGRPGPAASGAADSP
jgi:heme-degrading monooxygenase HmoA